MATRLTSYGDQNFALRVAVQQAYDRITKEIYDYDAEKTERVYDNMYEGNLTLDWELEHPTGIEPLIP